uniref:PARP catalytic domain-containing protein n=1 Tax=Panagrolaimus sp. ES5 TaxID=591445 RepID=A0AC34FBJ9_9BILA
MEADIDLIISGLKSCLGEGVLREEPDDETLPLNPQCFFRYTYFDIHNEENTESSFDKNPKTAIQILIKCPAGDHLALDVDFTIAQIKEMICKKKQIPPSKQMLVHGNEPQNLFRGGKQYIRPTGSKRFAIKVLGEYPDDQWLGSDGNSDEWPVAYHGTKESNVLGILSSGFDLAKLQRYTHGKGIYCAPDPQTALEYARSYTYEVRPLSFGFFLRSKYCLQGNDYYLIFETRVNPKTFILVKEANPDAFGHGEYWLVPDVNDIRPYGVCVYPVSGSFPPPSSSHSYFCSIC